MGRRRDAIKAPPARPRDADTLDDACPHCGEEYDQEEADHVAKHGPLECPTCSREGCSACMPAGVGVPCPDCEEIQGR